MQNNEKPLTKPEKLAKIIYRAIVRYTQAKKPAISDVKPNFRLDFNRIWRGNVKEIIDDWRNNHE